MKFEINSVKNGQTEVIFDAKLELNKVEFSNKNDLHIGLGEEKITLKVVKKLSLTLAQTANKFNLKSLFIPVLSADFSENDFVFIATQTLENNNYQVQKIGLKPPPPNPLQTVIFSAGEQISISKALAFAGGMGLARGLGDLPSNICTPSYLADVAEDLAAEFGLECEILEQKDMAKLGMNSLLSVAKGSVEAPKFITLSYKNNSNSKPIVLIGKGVTFDSGGISLKPGTDMDEMKYDMCGAAAVLGTMQTIARLKAKINLTVVLPAVENMPAHNASKPGDVVKSMSGQTIEILNTDAEGRLILCDALTFVKKFNPAAVIDVAT
ncbi:MAG: leucyl aminopeptidase, partial [Candidatus Thioglobus sp.]|nr:leucyl aminopeptidase [Candidatus Thioglobus sp.]